MDSPDTPVSHLDYKQFHNKSTENKVIGRVVRANFPTSSLSIDQSDLLEWKRCGRMEVGCKVDGILGCMGLEMFYKVFFDNVSGFSLGVLLEKVWNDGSNVEFKKTTGVLGVDFLMVNVFNEFFHINEMIWNRAFKFILQKNQHKILGSYQFPTGTF